MDADVQSKFLFFFEQFWSFLTVSIAVAIGGTVAKRVVALIVPSERQFSTVDNGAGPYRSSPVEVATDSSLPLWYRIWRATLAMHPVIVGGLAGLLPLPSASWVPDSIAAHVLWFGLAGAVSGQVYEIGRRVAEIVPAVIRKWLGVKSEPPPPPPSPELSKDSP